MHTEWWVFGLPFLRPTFSWILSSDGLGNPHCVFSVRGIPHMHAELYNGQPFRRRECPPLETDQTYWEDRYFCGSQERCLVCFTPPSSCCDIFLIILVLMHLTLLFR